MTTDLRYPIGRFEAVARLSPVEREERIAALASLPEELRAAVAGLSPEQLDTPYRPGGWTVRQVVHHLADSHMNAYVRFKLAVTEEEPVVKTYDEAAWAELADARLAEVELSLRLLESLHARWVVFLRSLSPAQWERGFRHPEHGLMPLERVLQLYAWHGRHHVAHITSLRARMGW